MPDYLWILCLWFVVYLKRLLEACSLRIFQQNVRDYQGNRDIKQQIWFHFCNQISKSSDIVIGDSVATPRLSKYKDHFQLHLARKL